MPQTRRSWCVFALAAIITSLLPDVLGGQSAGGGFTHSVFLKSDGTVWAVGANGSGQLGDNSTTLRYSPVQTSGLSDIVAIAAGAYHTMAITSTGSLYVWGLNNTGQVGDNSTTNRPTPVQLTLTNVVAIAAGANHSVALKSNGDAYTWGYDTSGQLGDGTASATNTLTPTQVMSSVAAIAADERHNRVHV